MTDHKETINKLQEFFQTNKYGITLNGFDFNIVCQNNNSITYIFSKDNVFIHFVYHDNSKWEIIKKENIPNGLEWHI